MTTNAQTALHVEALSASLTTGDLERSIRFYEGLGFGIDERWEENGELLGVMMRAGDILIGLSQDDWEKGRDRVKGVGLRFFLKTAQDLDQVASRARGAGVSLDSEPHETPWGTRAFEVTDPDGFKLTVTSDI